MHLDSNFGQRVHQITQRCWWQVSARWESMDRTPKWWKQKIILKWWPIIKNRLKQDWQSSVRRRNVHRRELKMQNVRPVSLLKCMLSNNRKWKWNSNLCQNLKHRRKEIERELICTVKTIEKRYHIKNTKFCTKILLKVIRSKNNSRRLKQL